MLTISYRDGRDGAKEASVPRNGRARVKSYWKSRLVLAFVHYALPELFRE